MKNLNCRHFKSGLSILLVNLLLSSTVTAQKADTSRTSVRFAGAVSVTNKGISTIPNLTLGKPAAIFDLSAGKGKLSFEPQLRFALEGKPWSFLFWWRYRFLRTERFQLNAGAHPAFSFKRIMIPVNGHEEEELVVRRYLAGELVPTWSWIMLMAYTSIQQLCCQSEIFPWPSLP